jgi:molecular chaperone IbpA
MTLIRSPYGTLLPSTVGFDRIFNVFENMVTEKTNFPHHNILKTSDNTYVVELAVAGFAQEEIDIEIVDSTLNIRGEKTIATPDVEYLHRGIATRSFHKTVRLADTVEVSGADLENGILKVYLDNKVEEKKAIKVKIGKTTGKKQLLQE